MRLLGALLFALAIAVPAVARADDDRVIEAYMGRRRRVVA